MTLPVSSAANSRHSNFLTYVLGAVNDPLSQWETRNQKTCRCELDRCPSARTHMARIGRVKIHWKRSFGTYYSDWYDFYPWTINTSNQHLVCSTPAVTNLETVEDFRGQGAPGLVQVTLDEGDFGFVLLRALIKRWRRVTPNKSRHWSNRRIPRSDNRVLLQLRVKIFHSALPARPTGSNGSTKVDEPSKHTASLRPCGVMGWAAMDQRVIPLEWTSSSFPFVICVAGDIYQGQRTEEVLLF